MKLETEVQCPSCKRKIKIKAEEMIPGKKKTCPSCCAEITFSGDDGRKIQKAIDDLEKNIKKTFKIKI
jgi:hypothetical protein